MQTSDPNCKSCPCQGRTHCVWGSCECNPHYVCRLRDLTACPYTSGTPSPPTAPTKAPATPTPVGTPMTVAPAAASTTCTTWRLAQSDSLSCGDVCNGTCLPNGPWPNNEADFVREVTDPLGLNCTTIRSLNGPGAPYQQEQNRKCFYNKDITPLPTCQGALDKKQLRLCPCSCNRTAIAINPSPCPWMQGRAKCPPDLPIMCAEPNDCGDGANHCCEKDCTDHGGPRPCPTIAPTTMQTPAATTVTPSVSPTQKRATAGPTQSPMVDHAARHAASPAYKAAPLYKTAESPRYSNNSGKIGYPFLYLRAHSPGLVGSPDAQASPLWEKEHAPDAAWGRTPEY
eukprot:gene57255-biopygen77040